ncbi:MAG: hypothetical protein AB1659_00060 [Thermodesulfobacteriota bacterium]
MNRFHIFTIRAVLGIVFAVVLTRMFFGKTDPVFIGGLAIFLTGMAYVTEYFRNRKKDK